MSNDFIPFAVGGSANVITQPAYAALTAITQNGFQSGLAQSNQLNKVWRQSSIMAAVLAQFIVDQSGQNAVDDGTTATLETNLIAAIRNAAKQTVILTDTGVANAYTATNTPALTVLPGTGYTQRVNIAHANTGASTYAPDGLTAKPIYGLGLQPLQGGELPVGVVILMYLVQAGVNSGNGAWIIIESLGGASQIAPATQSQHAVSFGQIGAVGQCRLNVISTTQLSLAPYNGNVVNVNGAPLVIPGTGVNVSNSGLAASTLYYVYLGGTTASPTLVLSTTSYSVASNGVVTQTGNIALTLVGMIYTNSSSQFVDSQISRTCLSWFNRRARSVSLGTATGYNFTSTTPSEVSTALRIFFLSWADEATIGGITGEMSNTIAGASVSVYSSVDGNSFGTPCGVLESSAGGGQAFASQSSQLLGEGFHTASVYGNVTSGTGSVITVSNSYITRG